MEVMDNNISDLWAIMIGKGYKGPSEFIRSISPKKKTIRDVLSGEEECRNINISSDSLIVENFFGSL